MSGHLLLITGGVRSGKSRLALGRAAAAPGPVLVVATGVVTDAEMASRIGRHHSDRPVDWRTLERRYDLAAALQESWQGERCLVVEDLATLVTNLLVERSADETSVHAEVGGLLEFGSQRALETIVVSQEVGLGLVPTSPLGRQFRDLLGLANQEVAAAADEVILMVAGLPVHIKGSAPPPG